MTYRDFQIPKKNGFRLISAPDTELLSFQKSILPELNEALEVIANEHNVNNLIHGFRYNHNCITAAQQHIGYQVTLLMDISNFFNSVTREHFNYTHLYLPNEVFHADGYTAQGFATSPILCNIAIIPALAEIKEYLENLGIENTVTIYADDLQISTNIPDVEFQIFSLSKAVTDILNKYNLKINPSKTHIAYAKYGYRRILGVNVGNTEIKPTRKLKRRIRAARYQQNSSSLGGLVTWSRNLLPRALR